MRLAAGANRGRDGTKHLLAHQIIVVGREYQGVVLSDKVHIGARGKASLATRSKRNAMQDGPAADSNNWQDRRTDAIGCRTLHDRLGFAAVSFHRRTL